MNVIFIFSVTHACCNDDLSENFSMESQIRSDKLTSTAVAHKKSVCIISKMQCLLIKLPNKTPCIIICLSDYCPSLPPVAITISVLGF